MGWIRVELDRASWALVAKQLPVHEMEALEISGKRWQTAGFKSYQNAYVDTLEIDLNPWDRQFDIILAEQVWEHLKYPYRAGRNVLSMLRPGGYFYLSVPFLVRRHNDPIDCTRWTDIGLRYYLEEVGFSPSEIYTESWGNLAVVIGNLTQWTPYDDSHNAVHRLDNDPLFPAQTWGLARKAAAEAKRGDPPASGDGTENSLTPATQIVEVSHGPTSFTTCSERSHPGGVPTHHPTFITPESPQATEPPAEGEVGKVVARLSACCHQHGFIRFLATPNSIHVFSWKVFQHTFLKNPPTYAPRKPR